MRFSQASYTVNPSVMQFQGKSLTQPNSLPSYRTTVVVAGLFCVESIQAKPNHVELSATTSPAAGSMEDRRGRT